MYGKQRRKELIIEVKFREEEAEDAKKAIQQGFAYEDIQYRGVPSNDSAENKLIKGSLSYLPLEDSDELCKALMKSLQYYGKAVQLKRFMRNNYFEGEAAALLYCTPVKDKMYQKLDSMVYLMGMGPTCPSLF